MSEQEPRVAAAARSHVGMHRTVNEDSVIAEDPYFLVADGLGGHEAGDLASQAAVSVFAERLGRPAALPAIEYAIERARAAVLDVSRTTSRGAGTTLSGVIRCEHDGFPCWYVVNVGDSRVYLLRGGAFTQLTSDHSLFAELEAAGRSEAADVPRNVITRALGAGDSRHDSWLLPMQTGDRILVCSDGLTNELTDEELRGVLTVGGRPESVADELVQRACEAGGHDNISVVVVDTLFALEPPPDTGGTDAQSWDSSFVDTADDATRDASGR